MEAHVIQGLCVVSYPTWYKRGQLKKVLLCSHSWLLFTIVHITTCCND